MENASKALIMAAAILISVIIVSLGVYLFTYFAGYASGVEDEVRANQIAQFNSQFLSFENRELTIYDVITIANMAKDYNQENEYTAGTRGYIIVTPPTKLVGIIGSVPPTTPNRTDGSPNTISAVENKDPDLIGKNVTVTNDDGETYETYKLTTYRCIVTIDEVTKMVSEIQIQ